MITSLRFWLISSFYTVLLICFIAVGLFVKTINKSKKLEAYHSNLKSTRILLLEINKLKEDILQGDFDHTDFFSKEISEADKRFDFLNKKTKNYIHLFETSPITKEYNLETKIDYLKSQLAVYDKTYKELIYLYKFKGYKEYGLEGKIEKFAKEIYSYDNKDVRFYCLTFQLPEKDFLLRKDNSYLLEHNKITKNFIEFITNNKSIAQKDKNFLYDKLYYYNKYFNLLARIEEKIGTSNRKGYLIKSKMIFEDLASRIEGIDDELKLIETEQKEKLKNEAFIALIILVSFLLGVITLIIRHITKSLQSINGSFKNYVDSSFNIKEVSYKKSKIKEFNGMYISFLKMAKEINVFTNFFKEKVDERTLEINQQKNEILAQQQQIEEQYNTLLHTNEELNKQRHLLALKNEDLHQSLVYAKRIQKAMQPRNTKFKESLKDSFIFTKPRDVVSGDFHLLFEATKSDNYKEEKTVFIASDCTGHGVSGALMSVLGINILHRLVKDLKVTDPAKILNLLDKDVNQILAHDKKQKEIVADGMDIAVFAFNKESYVLEYSIAKFSHFLIRDKEMIPLVTQKSTIGYSFFEKNKSHFETYSIQLQPGDSLYLFSDGFQDQFGGPENKKYKKNKIKELIENISKEPMYEQKRLFKEEFKTWKGHQKQTDDISVIGIRF
jgi:serine phosphatase RsbU (regulator of sigma subunit)